MNRKLLMQVFVFASAAFLSSLVSAQEAADTLSEESSLESLAWLSGHWIHEAEGRRVEEVWLAPAGGVMVGVNRDVRPGRRGFFEYLRIEEDGDGITYWASPMGGEATPFRLVEQGEHRAAFTNPQHDFPQRITYWLDGEGRLRAKAEAEADGQVRASEWVWERAG